MHSIVGFAWWNGFVTGTVFGCIICAMLFGLLR